MWRKNGLQEAVKLKDFKTLDLSFAHSNFPSNFASTLFTNQFHSGLYNVKLNFGSIPL